MWITIGVGIAVPGILQRIIDFLSVAMAKAMGMQSTFIVIGIDSRRRWLQLQLCKAWEQF